MVVFLSIIGAVIAIAILVAFLNRFYRKSTRDVALVRTGFRGQKVVLSGGCLVLPFLHKVEEINMRTNRVEVKRTGDKSLITTDRIRVDVELEFYVRVQPTAEGVATAAQAIGARALNPEGIRNLLEGRFIDALQSVAAAETMDKLHEKRGEFVRHVADQLRDNLGQNGMLLDSVSLTRLDQAPFASLDENNAFNAVGMRQLAEIIATNKKQRTQIEAEAEIAVRQTQLEATKRRLTLQQQEEQAQLVQRLEIEKTKASSDAEAAKAREDAMVASENARISRERETKAMELTKQRELRKLEIEAKLNSEMHTVDSSIRLAAKHVDEAKAQAEAERARAEVVLAQEHVQTERERAIADRSREMALKRVLEEGEVEAAKAETEADVVIKRAQADSQAVRTRAEGERLRLLAESEGAKARIAAENTRSDSLTHLELERYRLERLPEIVAQMMKPAEKIESIRIHQVTGLGGAPGTAGGNGDGGSRPPVNQVMDSILGMALQLPALKSIGESIGYDFSTALPKTGGAGEQGKEKQS
ncbi:MAG TPA: flotillin domain-containing protein [Burkholderiales bacterium]|nr:flotillin domain-containing protein [Burkholderiales bacterium]